MAKLIFVLFIVCLAAGLCIFGLSHHVKRKSLNALHAAGFDVYSVENIDQSLGALTFENIALDKDAISTIQSYQTSLNPDNTLQVKLSGINLVGEWSDNDGFSIAGFDLAQSDFGALPIDVAYINNAGLSLLTNALGGITFNGDGHLNRAEDELNFKTKITSAQKDFALDATVSGTLSPSAWQIEGEINEAKIKWPSYKAKLSRGHGTFSANGGAGNTMQYFAQINAGGFEIWDTPWQNAAITFERRGEHDRIFLTANGIDNEAMELTLTKVDKAVEASLYAPDGQTMITFLNTYGHGDKVADIVDIGAPLTLKIKGDHTLRH